MNCERRRVGVGIELWLGGRDDVRGEGEELDFRGE